MAERKGRTTTNATVVLSNVPGYYYGYTVTTVLGAGTIILYDALTAVSGTEIDIIPATTAAGATKNLANPIRLTVGLTAVQASTGVVIYLID